MSAAATEEGEMRALALETSGRVGSLAAFRIESANATIIASNKLPADLRSAQSLLPAIGELLKTCQWRADQLDLVCTTTGPGSFTGLRLAVTTAKTLAYATGAKLVGVHTLAALAAAVASTEPVWAILDAQRQELFAACFPLGWQNDANFVPETSVLSIDAWLAQLRAGDLVTGPPLEKLSSHLPPGVLAASSSMWQPNAEVVARLGLAALRRSEVTDPLQLVPRYFRTSAAEEKAQSRP
jgi:tRNA threonylcarbamoyladenosine biosynthesis protein TsaB